MARPAVLEVLLRAKDALSPTLRKVGAEAKGLATGLSSIGGSLGGVLATLGTAISARAFLDVNVEFERLRAQLRAFARNDADSSEQFETIRRFAVETPFELADLTQAFIELRAAGLKPTQDEFRALGDLASALGRPINELGEAIKAAGAGNVERLNRFGVTARVQGDRIAISFQGATTEVARNAQAVQNYLVQLSRSNFAGAMEKQVRTLGGAMSNLSDAVANLAASIGESGLGRALGSGIRGLTSFIDKARELLNLRTGNFADPIKQEMAILDLMERERELAEVAGRQGYGAPTAAVRSEAVRELQEVRQQLAELRREANAMAKERASNAAKDAADDARRNAGIPDVAGAARRRLPFFRDGTQSPNVFLPGVDDRGLGAALPTDTGADLRFGFTKEQDIDLRRTLDTVVADSLPTVDRMAQGLTTTFDALGASIESAFAAMVDGSMSAGFAFETAMKAALAGVAREFARFFTAKAVAAFAGQDYAGGAGYLAAAAGMSAISGSIQGSVNRAARGVGGVGGGAFGVVPTSRGLGGAGGEGVIVVQGSSFLDMSDPRQADALSGALRTLTGRNITIRTGLSR